MLANHPNVLSGGGVATNIIGGTGLFADGTVAAPSISFLADQDTGIYRIGANDIGVAAGGVLRARVDSAGITSLGLANQILTTDYVTGTTGSNMQMALLAPTGDTSGKLEVYNHGGATGGVLNINTGGSGAVNFGYGNATFGGNIILPQNGYIGKSNTFALQFGGTDYGFINTSLGYCVIFSNSAPTNSLVIASSGAATFAGAVVAPSLTAPASTNLALAAGSGNQNITLTPSGTGYVGLSVNPANTSNGTAGSYSGAGFAITYGAAYGTAFGSNASGQGWIQHQSFVNGSYYNLSLQAAGGRLLVGTTVDSGALLQVGTNTITSAGGMVFGTDAFIYRYGTGSIAIDSTSATTDFELRAGSGTLYTMLTNSGDNTIISARRGTMTLQTDGTKTALTLDASQNATFAGFVRPVNVATASAPAYAKGVIYFDTTLNKLRVGGATAFETITSV